MAVRYNYDPAPDARAVAYLEGKGLQRSWRWTSVWRDQHAFGFTLAGVYRLDVLAAAHELTTQAVAQGETLETFKAAFQERLEKLGFAGPQVVEEFEEGPRKVNLSKPARLKVIYDTNVRGAYAAAEWQAIIATKADFPALEYAGVDDEVTRHSHRQWFGVVLSVDHDFWATYYPPNDYFCRCWPIQVSIEDIQSGRVKLTTEADLERRGYKSDPAFWPIWRDKHTGREARVPPGVGPGFAYNAGMARRANVGDLLARRVNGLDPDMARAAAADLVNLPQFGQLVADAQQLGLQRAAAKSAAAAQAKGLPRAAADQAVQDALAKVGAFPPDSWPVAVMPADLSSAGVAQAVVANASAIGHSADQHPTTPADWGRVQRMLTAGEIWRAASGEMNLFGSFGGQLWFAALKPVDGAWRVRTLFPTSPRRRARITAGRERVRLAADDLQIEE